jgi:hypothetical protein
MVEKKLVFFLGKSIWVNHPGKKSDWVKSGKIYLKLVSESLLLKNKWAIFPLV